MDPTHQKVSRPLTHRRYISRLGCRLVNENTDVYFMKILAPELQSAHYAEFNSLTENWTDFMDSTMRFMQTQGFSSDSICSALRKIPMVSIEEGCMLL